MQSEEDKKKKRKYLVILILLILFIFFLLYWFFSPYPRGTTPAPSDQTTGFSPFNRPSDYTETNLPVEYAKPTPVVQQKPPTAPTYTEPTYVEPEPVVQTPAPAQTFYNAPELKQTFNFPAQAPQQEEPVVYSGVDTPKTPVGSYTYYTPPPADPQKPQKKPPQYVPPPTQPEEKEDIGKIIFGIATGLGWLQYTGDIGEQLFNAAYTTSNPLGSLFGGGGGGGFGGGGGGGGSGGATQNFGGSVSQVTYCTCSGSIMLDINDVRGGSVSLIYQPGASTLYKNYNVFGTNQNVLGTYTSGGSCLVEDGPTCSTEGSPRGTIRMIGTSQN